MLANKEFFEGIALKKCVAATYNNMRVILAPHIIYTKHDEMHVDAVTVERDGQQPRELKVGVFKLSGLKDVEVQEREFVTMEIFEPSAEKYDGTTLLAVDA